jgi:hypothetical protein
MARETTYGRYIIRSMKISAEWNARAFRGKAAAGIVHSGATEDAAILAAKAAIDANHALQRAARGLDGFPTAAEVQVALATISMTDGQSAMLRAHLLAPENIMTATELATAGGYDSYVSANSQYGALGRKLAEELEWHPPEFKGVPTWTFALATGADGENRADIEAMGYEQWRWKLRPEVAEAFNQTNTK